MIDDKTRAKVLREYAEKWTEISLETANCIRDDADDLDPSTPGTIVWWQDTEGLSDPALGQVNEFGYIEMFGTSKGLDMDEVKWWPARIAGPGQVAVDRQAIVEAIAFLRFEEHIFSAERLQAALDRDTEARR